MLVLSTNSTGLLSVLVFASVVNNLGEELNTISSDFIAITCTKHDLPLGKSDKVNLLPVNIRSNVFKLCISVTDSLKVHLDVFATIFSTPFKHSTTVNLIDAEFVEMSVIFTFKEYVRTVLSFVMPVETKTI